MTILLTPGTPRLQASAPTSSSEPTMQNLPFQLINPIDAWRHLCITSPVQIEQMGEGALLGAKVRKCIKKKQERANKRNPTAG